MSQPFFGIDAMMDSEDLMSWLLLNPEVDTLATTYATLTGAVNNVTSSQVNSVADFDMSLYNEMSAMAAQVPLPLQVPPIFPQQPNAIPIMQGNDSASQFPFSSNYVFPGMNALPVHNQNAAFNNIPSSGSSATLTHNRSSFDLQDDHCGFNTLSVDTQNSSVPTGSTGSKKLTQSKLPAIPTPTASSNASINAAPTASSSSSKKRPRESIEDLENRVKELRAENEDLHTHYLNVTQRTTEVQKQRAEMEKMMDIKLAEIGDRNDGDQTELAKIVKQYTDLYADYGKCRQREVSFHLQQLEKLVVPTMTTKMCLWTLNQDPSFYQKNRSPMFDILCKELELTPEQIDKILEKREHTSLLLAKLRECLDLIESLKTAIEKKHKCYDNICGRVQAAASPKQVVIFLRWISKNANVLAKHIQGFSRSIQHVPNVEFVHSITKQFLATTTGFSSSLSSSSSSSSAAHPAAKE